MSVDQLINLGATLTVIEMMITRLLPKWRKLARAGRQASKAIVANYILARPRLRSG